jgi:insulysin
MLKSKISYIFTNKFNCHRFDVLADHGEKALDIFSNFFICPEFSKSGTQREVQAVDSENSKNLVNDGRRRWQVLKSLADSQHHFSKFSTGNRITLPACTTGDSAVSNCNAESETGSKTPADHPLKDILGLINGEKHDEKDMAEFVRAALLAFHKRHYTPENMSAVMIGPQSLDELESWVVPRFGRIPDRWLNRDDGSDDVQDGKEGDDNMLDKEEKWQELHRAAAQLVDESASDAPRVSIYSTEPAKHHSAFRPDLQGGQWPVVVTAKPLKDIRKLVLFFPLPPTWRSPDRSPTSVLSHLLGHEGPGSAFALLQNKGWITSLNAGNRVHAPDQCLFKIEMTLTAEGEKHWAEATGVIFDYGKMLRRAAEESLKSIEGDAKCHNGNKELWRIWGKIFSSI